MQFANFFHIEYVGTTNTYILFVTRTFQVLCTSSSYWHIVKERIPYFVEKYKTEEELLEALNSAEGNCAKSRSWVDTWKSNYAEREWEIFQEDIEKSVVYANNKKAIELGKRFFKKKTKAKTVKLSSVPPKKEEPVKEEIKPTVKPRLKLLKKPMTKKGL